MFRLILSVLAAALLFGATTPVTAAEPYEADVEAVEVPEAPFGVQILQARWERQAGGSYVLAVDYAVENRGDETLETVGWSLAVEAKDGTPKGFLTGVGSCNVEPGKTASFSLVLNEGRLGGFSLADRLRLGGTASSGRRCQGGEFDCNKARFACEQHCNNPLGTNAGVKSFSCGNCQDWYDPQQECWARRCEMTCECGDLIWPDQMPAIDVFLDWGPVMEGAPVDPWPY